MNQFQLGLKSWSRAWLLLPLLIFLAAFFVYPVSQLLWLSFVDPNGNPSLKNYVRLATTPVYLQVLWVTFKVGAWTTVFSILGGYPVAYLIANCRARARDVLMLLVLMPFWTSFLVKTFAWIILLGRTGLINDLILALGIAEAPVEIIYNFTGVMIGMIHSMLPLVIISMAAVMETIDPRLTQAAHALGARGGQAFWRIYFPLSLPGVAAGGLLVFITVLGFFITPALLGGPQETMIAQMIITVLTQLFDWAFAGSLALLLLVTATVVFILYNRLLGVATLAGGETNLASVRITSGLMASCTDWISRQTVGVLGWIGDRLGEAIEWVFRQRSDQPRTNIPRCLLWTVVVMMIFFMLVPSLFVVPVSFTADTFLTFPPQKFSFRWYETYWNSPGWIAATTRSLVVAFFTGIVATVLGTAAAFVLARQNLAGRIAVLTLVLSPLILPRIIIAVALFYLFAHLGIVDTNLGLVIGHTVLAVPYVVITVMAVLRTFDERQEHAAWSLGANKWKTFYYVTLPQIRAGILAGYLFAFITSFDDLTIALFVSGGGTATLPKQMWTDLFLNVNPTLAAVSTIILVLVSVFVLGAEFLRRRATRERTSEDRA